MARSVYKIIELVGTSKKSWEDAAKNAVETTGKSLKDLRIAEVTKLVESPNNHQVWFKLPTQWLNDVFTKGYIGIDGISLTIGEVEGNEFNVNLIPETLQRTNIGSRKIGDRINIEIDPQTQAIVDTVERVMGERGKS